MKTLYIMSGISGSGKSTVAKTLFPFATYLNADSIRRELTGDESDQTRNTDVFKVLYERLKWFVEIGVSDIIVDNTSLTVHDRKKIIDHAKKYGDIHVVIVFIKPDIGLAIYRNSMRERKVPIDVIRRQFQKIQWPTAEEKSNYSVLEISV